MSTEHEIAKRGTKELAIVQSGRTFWVTVYAEDHSNGFGHRMEEFPLRGLEELKAFRDRVTKIISYFDSSEATPRIDNLTMLLVDDREEK